MALERFIGRAEIDARADVYSLACVLDECLTSTAFRGRGPAAPRSKIRSRQNVTCQTIACSAPAEEFIYSSCHWTTVPAAIRGAAPRLPQPGESEGRQVPLPQVSQQIGQRLEELYRRHLPILDDDVTRYYVSGQGYQTTEPVGSHRERFGICLTLVDGSVFRAGDWDTPFALQSISKLFVYGLALADNGREHVLRRVGVEPSGNAFNSIVLDELNKRPFNPMVNAGAIATSALVKGNSARRELDRSCTCYAATRARDLVVDRASSTSEWHGHRNRAMAYLHAQLRHARTMTIEATLDLYFKQCSILVTCRDLAMMAATLANGGVNPITRRARRRGGTRPRHPQRHVHLRHVRLRRRVGLLASACRPRAASAAGSSRWCPASSASACSRRRSTRAATACAASGSAKSSPNASDSTCSPPMPRTACSTRRRPRRPHHRSWPPGPLGARTGRRCRARPRRNAVTRTPLPSGRPPSHRAQAVAKAPRVAFGRNPRKCRRRIPK